MAGKPYANGRFQLELDGNVACGYVSSVDGGHFKAEAVKSQVGGHGGTSVYAGKPKFDDITLSVGMAATPVFWKWIDASLHNKPERRNGAIVGFDMKNHERTRRSFYNALISEIGFPGMDGTSKNSAMLTLKISPESVDWDPPSGKLKQTWANEELTKQKMFLASNFQFSVDKFAGKADYRHAKVDAFTVKQGIMQSPVGDWWVNYKEPGKIEIPNISVTFATAHVDDWVDWWEDTVIDGNLDPSNGHLAYFQSNMAKDLMRVEFRNMTLLSLEFDKFEAQKEGIAMVKAVLQVEDLAVKMGPGTV
jgi:phage tail-like protein